MTTNGSIEIFTEYGQFTLFVGLKDNRQESRMVASGKKSPQTPFR